MKRRVFIGLAILLALGSMCFCAAAEESVLFPVGLEVIEQEAFMGDTALGTVVIPEGVRVVGERAFADSARMRRVSMSCCRIASPFRASAFHSSRVSCISFRVSRG